MLEWVWTIIAPLFGKAASRAVERGVDGAFERCQAIPRLRVISDAEERTATNGVSEVRQFYARLKVRAEGNGVLKNCRGFLCKVENVIENRPVKIVFEETFPLICSYDESVEGLDLVEGAPRTIDVVMCEDGHTEISLRLRTAKGFVRPTTLNDQPLTYGKYRFSSLVTTEDGQREQAQFDLSFHQSWPPTLTRIA
jgi:hypothetical protein